MSNEEMGCAKATAIACANAVVKHAKLGLFMSEYDDISEHNLRLSRLVGNARYSLAGRTTSGQRMLAFATMMYKDPRDGLFPVAKVYVLLESSSLPKTPTYFECTFDGDDIRVTKLDNPPY